MQSLSRGAELASYGGVARGEIARRTGSPAVQLFESVTSTMDVAHELAAEGAESGCLVVAESQSAGRGREGKKWHSDSGGVWLTYLSRNPDTESAQVLSIRVGLALRGVLQDLAESKLMLKWPNDVFDEQGKVAGVLVETRWKEGAPEWTAIGIGVNVTAPPRQSVPGGAGLRPGVSKSEVLCEIVARVRQAAAATGALTREEVQEYMQFDMLRGRKVSAPASGIVVGISEDGELVISGDDGILTARSGSVVVVEDE
jgi:BirA family biotin operon repressor/biotin-[acetyl-CoA-carboxylase] ligase